MVEVNEEIIRQYLELQGFFVKNDVKYFQEKAKTGKKGSGWSDIDLLAIHPDGRRYLIEVKGWHTEWFTGSYFDKKEPYINNLAREETTKLFRSEDFKTILVVPAIGPKSQESVLKLAKEEGIDDIWEFKEILKELIRNVQENISYDSEVLQVIRLLKVYGFFTQNDQKPTNAKTMVKGLKVEPERKEKAIKMGGQR
jgi:hypothetical protein